MEPISAVDALSALAHPSRLGVFRLLIKAGPEGLSAGAIAHEIGSLANTLSANLAVLSGAGLIVARRDGRRILYRANHERMRALLDFLVDDCCGGRPEICAGLGAARDRLSAC